MGFVHVGYGNLVNADKVTAIVRPNTQSGKRYLKNAKTKKTYIDAALGRALRALLILDDGGVMGSAISLRTLLKRFNGDEKNVITEEEEEMTSAEAKGLHRAEQDEEADEEEEDTEDEDC